MVAKLEPRVAAYEKENVEDFDENVTVFYLPGWEIAAPDEPARFLVKDADYSYLAVEENRAIVHPEGFERPALRYLPPRAVIVARLPLEVVVGDEGSLHRSITDLWNRMTRSFDLPFEETGLRTSWPEAPIASFGYGVDPEGRAELNYGRAILASALTNAELAECADRLPPEFAEWAAERIRSGRDKPTLSQLVRHHVAIGAWRDLKLLGEATRPEVLTLLANSEGPLRRRAVGALARIDPTGQAFEDLELPSESDLHDVLVEAIDEFPEIAMEFEAPRALRARQSAVERLAQIWLGELTDYVTDDERRACRHLLELGYEPQSLEQEVRIRVLDERWDMVVDLGEVAIAPLIEILGTEIRTWHDDASESLETLARRYGPSTAADELALARGDIPAIVGARLRENQRLLPLFGADARTDLLAMDSPEAMAELARNAPDPRWAELAALWEADRGVQDLLALRATGRLALEAGGNTISVEALDLVNRSDHTLRVRIPSGLKFAAGGNFQNMVTLTDVTLSIEPLSPERVILPAACANLDRPVPGMGDRFQIEPLEPDSELYRLSQVLGDASISSYSKQAAVWALTDDADYSDMGKFIEITYVGDPGSRAVGPYQAGVALQLLEEAGLDYRAARLWQDREFLLEKLQPGLVRDWLAER